MKNIFEKKNRRRRFVEMIEKLQATNKQIVVEVITWVSVTLLMTILNSKTNRFFSHFFPNFKIVNIQNKAWRLEIEFLSLNCRSCNLQFCCYCRGCAILKTTSSTLLEPTRTSSDKGLYCQTTQTSTEGLRSGILLQFARFKAGEVFSGVDKISY